MKARASAWVITLIAFSREVRKASLIAWSAGSYTILVGIYLSVMHPRALIKMATGIGSLIFEIVASIHCDELDLELKATLN